jgi:hypothetical protein
MPVRPIITILFLVTVLTTLLVISIFFPKNGIQITEAITIDFVKPEDIFQQQQENYANITEIIEKNAVLSDSSNADSSQDNKLTQKDTINTDIDSTEKPVNRLQFPNNNFRILDPFFEALTNARKEKKPVRILHYGDSQIEGDRISAYLRTKLQQKFGGMGIGLIPMQQVYDLGNSIRQKNSGNWYRFAVYGKHDLPTTQTSYGALASFNRFKIFSKDKSDLSNPGNPANMAWVSFAPSSASYANTKCFQQCRIFYGNNKSPFLTELYQDDVLKSGEIYPASSSFQTIRWTFDHPVSNLKIVFKGADSPDIYGIALDGLSGVALDNIPMRGSSGLIFTRMDRKNLLDHYLELNVKMIILQFGGNTANNLTNDYTYYEKSFYAQLKRIREILPDVAIIVIGVADMSIKQNGKYITYPNLEKLRDALRNATFEANGVYWDMFEAMGGRNSMPSWVFANPPLASKDFVHFNLHGSNLIAQMFYSSLVYEYNLYEKSLAKPKNKVNQ